MNIGGTLIAGPADRALHGTIRLPGDKSMSHRAVMLAALPAAARHAWLAAHLAALRAGRLTLTELP